MKSETTVRQSKTLMGRGNISANRVLETAAGLFYEKGFDRTSMNEIATALGVTKPSLYYYYPSKDAILMACINEAGSSFTGQLKEISGSNQSASDKVVAIFQAYADALRSNIHRVLILSDRRTLSRDGVELVARSKGQINELVTDLIQAAIDEGEFRDQDAKQAANAVFGMFNWMSFWRSETSFKDRKIDHAFIDFALHGLKGSTNSS